MRSYALIAFILIASVAFHAQGPAKSPTANQTPSSSSATRTFSSDVGFDISYPSDWTIVDMTPALPMVKSKIEGEEATTKEKSHTSCVQIFFNAKSGEPASVFIAVGATKGCLGAEPDLNAYALGTMSTLKEKYQLTETEYGTFTLKKTVFWVMRTKAAKIDHPDAVETIEYLGAVLPKGIVLWSAHCKNETAKAEFEHAHLRFPDGSDTAMIPAEAFRAIKTATKTLPDTKSEGTTQSATFTSDQGFSYSYPANWEVADSKPILPIAQMKAEEQATNKVEKTAASCMQVALLLQHGSPRSVILTLALEYSCLGETMKQGDLAALGSGIAESVGKNVNVKDPAYGAYKLGSHDFWIERAQANPKDHPERSFTLEVTCTILKKAMVCWMGFANDKDALDTFEGGRTGLEGEPPVPLVPPSAFKERK